MCGENHRISCCLWVLNLFSESGRWREDWDTPLEQTAENGINT